jgi:uncharacterized membrane protein
MLAGLQGAILLIAAKRQDAIAAAMAQHDYDTNVKAKGEIELLMDVNNQQLEILHELRGWRPRKALTATAARTPDTPLPNSRAHHRSQDTTQRSVDPPPVSVNG